VGKEPMSNQARTSYFRNLPLKLSFPVLIGSGILLLYYWKLLHLRAEHIQKIVLFTVVAIPLFLHLVMPEVEGLELLQQLKSAPETMDIPVIVLTGKGRMEDREKSIRLGAADFIAKPFQLQEIVQQVKKYFET